MVWGTKVEGFKVWYHFCRDALSFRVSWYKYFQYSQPKESIESIWNKKKDPPWIHGMIPSVESTIPIGTVSFGKIRGSKIFLLSWTLGMRSNILTEVLRKINQKQRNGTTFISGLIKTRFFCNIKKTTDTVCLKK